MLVFVRKAKSDAKKSMRARLANVTIQAPEDFLSRVRSIEDDLIAVGGIDEITYLVAERLDVTCVLAETE